MFATLQAKAIAALAVLLLGGGLFGWYTIHERHKGEAIEITALKKSSAALLKTANDKNAALTADHAKQVAAIIGVIDNERKANAARAASDADRLREYDAYRRQHPAVASAASGPANQAAGDGGPVGNDAIFSSLEQVAGQLADSTREGSTALIACMADRDKLTGK